MNLRISQKNQELTLKTQEHTLETRQTQLTMQLYEKMGSKEYMSSFFEILDEWSWKDFYEFMSKYGPKGNREKWMKFGSVCIEWEQIGILMKYGAFNPNMLYDQWAGFFISFWEKIEPILIGINSGGEGLGGYMEYGEDLYYFFKEAQLRDRVDFKSREQARLLKRSSLGLMSRPNYTMIG